MKADRCEIIREGFVKIKLQSELLTLVNGKICNLKYLKFTTEEGENILVIHFTFLCEN